ncbi:Cytochrome P450 52A3-A [Leucoagaricus sp. SymC.cos]|nr:Cytochrome P450 52A3-A [Leucoagaricus sp. SymC.cos]
MLLSPGLDLIGRTLLDFLPPCVAVYATLAIGSHRYGVDLPGWSLAVASLALWMGYIFSKPWIKEYKDVRAAKARGAVLVPHAKEGHRELVNALLAEVADGYPGDVTRNLCANYGTVFRFSIGFDQPYLTTEPEHIKCILATEFEAFEKGPVFHSQLRSLLGTGVFNADGEMWKFHRSITRPFFTRDRVSDFDNFERHAQATLQKAKARLVEGYPIDFQDLASRFTLDSATEFLFKNDVRSLEVPLPYPTGKSESLDPTYSSNVFVNAFVKSQETITKRLSIGTLWPLLEFWKDTVMPYRRTLDQFVQPFLEKGLMEKESRKLDSEEGTETLLDYLVDKTSDQNVIKDELINLLVAGRDTTTSLLTFSLYMLIEHPDIEQRLRQEIQSKVGFERAPTSQDIKEMKYLRAFLNEVLRLYPIVPVNVRTSTKPVVLPPKTGTDTPIYIPAGVRFIYSVFQMHRRKDLWGPDGESSIGCNQIGTDVPGWMLAVASLALKMGYIFLKPWIEEYKNVKVAKERGAVLAPHAKENRLKLVSALLDELADGYPCNTLRGLSDKYGTMHRFSIGFDQLYFTSKPDHIESILATEFEAFDKVPDLRSQMESLLGTGVFNSDGEMWKFHRSITRPFFTRDRITDFDNFERHAQDALKNTKARLAEGYPIDFQDLVSRFTLDSATEFLFKNDIHSLDIPLPYPGKSDLNTSHSSMPFVNAFAKSQEVVAQRAFMGTYWPLLEFWKDTIMPYRKTLDRFVQPFLDKGFKEKETRKTESEGLVETLLDYLVDKTEDQSVIRDELINLLVATRDTTTSLLTFSLYMLIEHPDIEQRLKREILEKVESERSPTSEDIKEMKYLRAFLNEVLRLYAIVTSTKPVIFAPTIGTDTPIYMPTGTRFVYSVFLMHRRKDLWGPDDESPLEFDPDRFLDERVRKHLVPNPFIFCPFNAGPRICLGQQFAYNETSFFLIRLLQQFTSFTLEESARPAEGVPKPEWFAYNETSFFLIRLLQQFTSFTLEESARPAEGVPKPEWVGIEAPQGKDKIRLKNSVTMYVRGGLWVKMKEVV